MDCNKNNQHHNSKTRDREEEEESSSKQSQPPPPSPSSSSSSPSHEFSFTISLHSVPDINRASPSRPSSIAVDLSPADDIFFHGHLLPLQFLSHIPSHSPRTSTNSIESFSIPIADPITAFETEQIRRGPTKPAKSFSLFGRSKWRKGFDAKDRDGNEECSAKLKRKFRFDLSHVIVRMVRPFLFFGRRRRRREFRCQPPYSFSGNLADLRNSNGDKMTTTGKRGGFFSSAPASMRTSPTNSGLFLATPTPTKNGDSTMEELQAAIQAAIAHCKNSIAVEDKFKCHG